MFNEKNLKERSLNDISADYLREKGINVSKQSLDERINQKAVSFIKALVLKSIEQELKSENGLSMKEFKRLKIKDSTSFQITERLSEAYPGSGGGGSNAGIRIQCEYDYLEGNLTDLSINAFNRQDQNDSIATLSQIEAKDLIIRDLGYINIKLLKGILSKDASFLSRLNSGTQVYEKKDDKYKVVDFEQIRREMKKNGQETIEMYVYIGSDKLKVRMILSLVSEEVYQTRMKRYNKEKKKKQHNTISASKKVRAHFNIFITNLSSEQLPKEQAWSLYRLRWQIEIFFKVWKSIIEIDKIKAVKKERLELYLYSKLLLIVLGWKIIRQVQDRLYKYEKKAISILKSFKTVLTLLSEKGLLILQNINDLRCAIVEMYKIGREKHILEKRKGKQTSLEVLLGLDIMK